MTRDANPVPAASAPVVDRARTVDLVLAFVVTFAPPVALVLGLGLWYTGALVPGPTEFVIVFCMHALTILGVELGYHRLLSHRSYRAHRWIKIALVSLGSMAFQGPVIWWVSIHRKHHRFPDKVGDPHSMYVHGQSGEWTAQGAVHAHMGWLWSRGSIGKGGFTELAGDLYKDKDLFWIHMHYLYFMLATFIVPALIGGLVYQTWQGALSCLLWGGFVRIFLSNHLTFWCINSVLHGVGRRAYDTDDHSTNLAILSLFTWGQGWHNNHHAYPAAAVMSHRRWELDPGAWVLFLLSRMRLVDRIVVAPADLASRSFKPVESSGEGQSVRPMPLPSAKESP